MEEKICNKCSNKHINDENQLFCWKGIDTSKIVSVCNDFTTDVIDEEFILERNYQQKILSSGNVLNYNYKKVKRFFVIMILLQILLFFQNLFVLDPSDQFVSFLYFILSIIFFIMMYKGKSWALFLYNILNLFALLGSIAMIGFLIKMSLAALLIYVIPASLYFSYQLYFLNTDTDFQKHLKAQRNE